MFVRSVPNLAFSRSSATFVGQPTIGYLADRRGTPYRQGIAPDIAVAVDISASDAALAAALTWIAQR